MPDYRVAPEDHDPQQRALLARSDGLDLAIVSLSSPLGIEYLAPHDGAELLSAYHEGALALPAPFRAWAAATLTEIDPAALANELDRGFVGLQLPATAVLSATGYARVAPLLELLERAERPLFIHPGPVPLAGRDVAGVPDWWPAIVDYVAQMHAAWYAFRALGRPLYPRLHVCFAMLAGLAPMHGERLAARAGERTIVDPTVFLDISSYGTRAVDAIVRVLGIDGLVNGSDRPYAPPTMPDLGEAALAALRSVNPVRLLNPTEVPNGLAVASPAST